MQQVSFGLEDVAYDRGYTGFTLDSGVADIASLTTYAQVVAGLSDAELCRVEVSDVSRIAVTDANKGAMNVERRGVIDMTYDNGTTSKKFQLSIPGISQANVTPNNPGAATVAQTAINAVKAAFAALTGYPAATLFVTGSRIYESRR